jgi:signal transduction histidine kinase
MKEVADDMPGKYILNFELPKIASDISLSPETKRNIFFIYKEALNNIVKHAEAKSINIKIEVADYHISVFIKDDGKGFDTSSIFAGNGLRNMKSRAEEINGNLNFKSSPGTGTLLELNANITQMRD